MDLLQSTIRAYQRLLSSWTFKSSSSFPEDFAIRRFQRKFERPITGKEDQLKLKAWEDFISFDCQLPSRILRPSGEWYKARHLIHMWCRGDFRRSAVDFPQGSSFLPTQGLNSIESRLSRGTWSCTPENFDEFSRLVYNHKALKRAARRRYTKWYQKQQFSETPRESDRLLWKRFGLVKNPGYEIFKWKLERVTHFVRGSRFSTVFKNNEKRRPINIESFGNILVQRQQGNFLRSCLKSIGIDLDTLADQHRRAIRDPRKATIDLKNASDSNTVALSEFLLPKSLFESLNRSRSFMLLGGDGEYHVLKKMSSMGNGYTFELMTLILTAISRTLDPTATVFGDDIIINKECAPRLIELLKEVGWVVNLNKSFIEGDFRESCGANWHDEYGYIKSFDFIYPTTIADCANILNKCYALNEYPAFADLYQALYKLTPKALRGGPFTRATIETFATKGKSEDIPIYFSCNTKGSPIPKWKKKKICDKFHLSDVTKFTGFRYVPKKASKTLTNLSAKYHWGKYEMYIHSGRKADDLVTGDGRWVLTDLYLADGRVFDSSLFDDA